MALTDTLVYFLYLFLNNTSDSTRYMISCLAGLDSYDTMYSYMRHMLAILSLTLLSYFPVYDLTKPITLSALLSGDSSGNCLLSVN